MMNLLMIFGAVGDNCNLDVGGLFGLPRWYEYLNGSVDPHGKCAPTISGLSDVWLIVAAIIEILLRVAALAAVAGVIYGGILYTTSQGSPDKTGQAKNALINALLGLAIAVSAAAAVSFVAGSIT